MEPNNPIVWQHLEAAAAVMDQGLQSLREQVGDEAYVLTAHAIAAGSTMQVITDMTLAGKKSLTLNLISPAGEVVNLGHVEFIDAVALN